jgi:hypothetical protein
VFNQIYTAGEYIEKIKGDWYLKITELPAHMIYNETIFDPLDERAVEEAERILTGLKVVITNG